MLLHVERVQLMVALSLFAVWTTKYSCTHLFIFTFFNKFPSVHPKLYHNSTIQFHLFSITKINMADIIIFCHILHSFAFEYSLQASTIQLFVPQKQTLHLSLSTWPIYEKKKSLFYEKLVTRTNKAKVSCTHIIETSNGSTLKQLTISSMQNLDSRQCKHKNAGN